MISSPAHRLISDGLKHATRRNARMQGHRDTRAHEPNNEGTQGCADVDSGTGTQDIDTYQGHSLR